MSTLVLSLSLRVRVYCLTLLAALPPPHTKYRKIKTKGAQAFSKPQTVLLVCNILEPYYRQELVRITAYYWSITAK